MPKQIRMKIFIAFMAFVSSATVVSSQLGYGNTKCALYNSIQKNGDGLFAIINSWSLGYLSGLNQAAMSDGEADSLRRHQPDRVIGFIKAYCESNSDKTVEQATNSYWIKSIDK